MAARVSQVVVEVLYTPDDPETRVSQTVVEVVYTESTGDEGDFVMWID